MCLGWDHTSVSTTGRTRILELRCVYVEKHPFSCISTCLHQDCWVKNWSVEKNFTSLEILVHIVFDDKIQPMLVMLSCIKGFTYSLEHWDNSMNIGFYDFTFASQVILSGKEPTYQCKRHKRCGFNPWIGTIPWRKAWQPTPVFLPGESHVEESGGLQTEVI